MGHYSCCLLKGALFGAIWSRQEGIFTSNVVSALVEEAYLLVLVHTLLISIEKIATQLVHMVLQVQVYITHVYSLFIWHISLVQTNNECYKLGQVIELVLV